MTSRIMLSRFSARLVTIPRQLEGKQTVTSKIINQRVYNKNNNYSSFSRLNAAGDASTSSESVTYSGGHASVGQGGFYGSGGARVLPSPSDGKEGEEETMSSTDSARQKVIALNKNVDFIRQTMNEVEKYENQLDELLFKESDDKNNNNNVISKEVIEIKNLIKKLMTSPEVLECLHNLEMNGEPIWGLNREERELVLLAREIVNEC